MPWYFRIKDEYGEMLTPPMRSRQMASQLAWTIKANKRGDWSGTKVLGPPFKTNGSTALRIDKWLQSGKRGRKP